MRGFLREYAGEMLRRSLQLVEKLEAVEKNEKEVAARTPTSFNPADSLDPKLAAALAAYNPSDPFQATLNFVSKMP